MAETPPPAETGIPLNPREQAIREAQALREVKPEPGTSSIYPIPVHGAKIENAKRPLEALRQMREEAIETNPGVFESPQLVARRKFERNLELRQKLKGNKSELRPWMKGPTAPNAGRDTVNKLRARVFGPGGNQETNPPFEMIGEEAPAEPPTAPEPAVKPKGRTRAKSKRPEGDLLVKVPIEVIRPEAPSGQPAPASTEAPAK